MSTTRATWCVATIGLVRHIQRSLKIKNTIEVGHTKRVCFPCRSLPWSPVHSPDFANSG